MKKFLLVLVIGATFAACNDSATTETPAGDTSSMAPAVDSPAMITPDTSAMKVDTSSKMMMGDTTTKK